MFLQSYVAKQQLSFNMLSAYVAKYFSLVTTKPQRLDPIIYGKDCYPEV